ncbi:MAG: prepilin-type N-terminal cleavage/methylation domain-containing protein [Patescibacteria group bacterium]
MSRRQLFGFTLLEVLVVVSIIGILASIVAVNLGSARVLARDARRKEDIAQLRTALELYYNDHRVYPPIESAQSNPQDLGWTTLQAALLPYVSALPSDPPGGLSIGYRYRSQGTGAASCINQWYVLEFQLEVASDPAIAQAKTTHDCRGIEYPSRSDRGRRIIGVGVSAL